jgi:hypothetical protein
MLDTHPRQHYVGSCDPCGQWRARPHLKSKERTMGSSRSGKAAPGKRIGQAVPQHFRSIATAGVA